MDFTAQDGDPMNRLVQKFLHGCALVLLLVSFFGMDVSAQTPDRVRELVLHVNAFQGEGWQGVLYPQNEGTIYLIAGQINTITPRYTMVYFWPITQEYLPDWTALDEAIDARMEIRSNGNVVKTLDLSDYVLQDPTGNQTPETTRLYVNKEANDRFNAYTAGLDAYWKADQSYLNQQENGTQAKEPGMPNLFSTKVLKGFLVNLDPGTYHSRLLDARGQPRPGGDKTIIVFAPRRFGIGYKVIPETKWTVPESSNTEEQTIYISNQARLFFQPQLEAEFNALDYNKMLDPQSPGGDPTIWMWVPTEKIEDAMLHFNFTGNESVVTDKGYVVNQLNNASLGYEIIPFDPQLDQSSPTFSGYELNLNLKPNDAAQLWLVNKDGQIIEGSRRTLQGVQPPARLELLIPSVLPFALALGMEGRRRKRRSMKSRKNS
jgi:hypothetical protein